MISIKELIYRLKHIKDSLSIKSFDDLVSALYDLDAMVGMKSAKRSVVLQIETLATSRLLDDNKKSPFDDQMQHLVISGPPGVGKTQLGKILARIWKSMGVLSAPKETPTEVKRSSLDNLISISHDLNIISDTRSTMSTNQRREIRYYASKLKLVHNQMFKNIKKPDPPKPTFRVVSRVDFVGGYVGQTAIKTMKLLEKTLGGVLFIDEAYSLIHDDKDSFGMEALTTLNQFMSEHPREIIVIFAGYKKMMEQGIFKRQPGLKSRCSWHLHIDSYSSRELATIFRRQLEQAEWNIDDNVDLDAFFEMHLDDFPDFGRNTSRLLFYCKLYHMDAEFVRISSRTRKRRAVATRTFTRETLLIAFDKYKLHRISHNEETPPPPGMYM